MNSSFEEIENSEQYKTYLNRRIMDTNVIQMGSSKAPHIFKTTPLKIHDDVDEYESEDYSKEFSTTG